MSYENAVLGLTERFEAVDDVKLVLDHEPSSVNRTPCIYFVQLGYRRTQEGQVTVMRYRVRARLLVLWQDHQKAEWELIRLTNSIPAAIDADPTLGGRITRGYAAVSEDAEAIASWRTIGNVLYRSQDIFVDIVDKGAYQSGI